jgi:hypothetical protein
MEFCEMNYTGQQRGLEITWSFVILLLFWVWGCQAPETGTLSPQLAFRISGETGLTAARDLTVDREGNVYVFDYGDYVIRKFSPDGLQLAAFGGAGEEPERFQHLMTIQAYGDSLLALDEGSLSVFNFSGKFRSQQPFADTVVCDLPSVHPDGRWAAEWIIEETADQALTYRSADGREQARLASYPLSGLFPGLRAGEMFFIKRIQAPFYLYDFLPDGRLVWMTSDHLRVHVHQEDQDEVLFESEATPIPFPAEEIAALEERQASLDPPLFMNVPQHYQTIHHLFVDGSGNIWLYLMSHERTGFLRLSPRGRESGFFTVEAKIDLLSARIAEANGRLYFLVSGREETAIFSVGLP